MWMLGGASVVWKVESFLISDSTVVLFCLFKILKNTQSLFTKISCSSAVLCVPSSGLREYKTDMDRLGEYQTIEISDMKSPPLAFILRKSIW